MGKYTSIEEAMQHVDLPSELTDELPQGHYRVAAYCRISMDSEGQSTSIELQRAVYQSMIEKNENWELVDIYADNGISGTLAKRRPEFQRMIADCEAGKIDLIITKSLSRFSRNTMDCILYIRKIQAAGAQIRFEKEKITTGEVCSELLLTILAAFAQEESRSMSENLKWGFRKRFEQGQEKYTAIYGYRKGEGTNYELVPQEAEVVRLIFNMYERGYGTTAIAKYLNEQGIPSPREGKQGWDDTRTSYILHNERYLGDTFMQKYHTEDHLTHKILKNKGEIPSYYIEDHHEPIIGRDQFARCQKIFSIRSKGDGLGQYPVSDMFRCPYCGSVLIVHRLPIQNCETHLCCENVEGRCRKFAIRLMPIKKSIMATYRDFDMATLDELSRQGNKQADTFLAIKAQHPEFHSLEYFWMNTLIDHIELGPHTYSESELQAMPPEERKQKDDRWMAIYWRCGVKTVVSSGVKRDSQHPKHIAELWDNYVMRYPDRYPKVTEQVLALKEGN